MAHSLTPFARSCLNRQGFTSLDEQELAVIDIPLRFTPALCLALTTVGLLTRSALLLGLLALAAAVAATGRRHAFDVLYDRVVRPLVSGPRLPGNPPPRTFAFVLAAPVLAGAAVAFAVDATAIGLALGVTQIAGCALDVMTGWCAASAVHERLFGAAGTLDAAGVPAARP